MCGLHFVSGRKSNDPTNVDYVPTQHLPLQHSTPTLKRRTINSERAENYSMALSKATSNKRKTIQRSGNLLFPLDLNDIQHEIVVSDDSESESTGNSDMPLYSGSTPDHTYHKFWVTPTNIIVDNASSCTDNSSQTVCDTKNNQYKQILQVCIVQFLLVFKWTLLRDIPQILPIFSLNSIKSLLVN